MLRWRCMALIAVLATIAGAPGARPFVPESDDVVVERLPEKGDYALSELKRLRVALAKNPRSLDLALPVARRALDAARSRGDPRFLGQAQAALSPWWDGDDVAAAALLLRATLKQSQHDFAGALADLDILLVREPAMAQARLTRATVLGVVGRYADARRDCERLRGGASALVVAACDAVPASLSGEADAAYNALLRALVMRGGSTDVREWALTLAAEIAARRGDSSRAEQHFAAALELNPRDAYLKAAYADFLLDGNRPADVVALLEADARSDALLLRLAIAERRLPDRRDAFAAHRQDLRGRFEAAARRGDNVHRREEARYRLDIEDDAAAAVALARANWMVQREPADVVILLDAARAANDTDALRVANAWLSAHGLDRSLARPARSQ